MINGASLKLANRDFFLGKITAFYNYFAAEPVPGSDQKQLPFKPDQCSRTALLSIKTTHSQFPKIELRGLRHFYRVKLLFNLATKIPQKFAQRGPFESRRGNRFRW